MDKGLSIPVSPNDSRKNKGFSLVELIIVIAIMAILAAAIAPALIRYLNKSRKASDIETASVIMGAVNAAYGEAYSFEGSENGTEQDADHIDLGALCTTSYGYQIEKIAIAKNNGTFTNNVAEQQHFLSLIREDLGKKQQGAGEFSNPKCKRDSGNGVPEGFLIARHINAEGQGDRFEVWITDSSDAPIYRLNPDCCKEYK